MAGRMAKDDRCAQHDRRSAMAGNGASFPFVFVLNFSQRTKRVHLFAGPPDNHPPERTFLAHRVTAELLAHKATLEVLALSSSATSMPTVTARRRIAGRTGDNASQRPHQFHPCDDCRQMAPRYYCDDCRQRWERERIDPVRKAKTLHTSPGISPEGRPCWRWTRCHTRYAAPALIPQLSSGGAATRAGAAHHSDTPVMFTHHISSRTGDDALQRPHQFHQERSIHQIRPASLVY